MPPCGVYIGGICLPGGYPRYIASLVGILEYIASLGVYKPVYMPPWVCINLYIYLPGGYERCTMPPWWV